MAATDGVTVDTEVNLGHGALLALDKAGLLTYARVDDPRALWRDIKHILYVNYTLDPGGVPNRDGEHVLVPAMLALQWAREWAIATTGNTDVLGEFRDMEPLVHRRLPWPSTSPAVPAAQVA